MNKFLFILISFFIIAVISNAEDDKNDQYDATKTFEEGDKKKEKKEFDSSETLNKDGDKKEKVEFDSTKTFGDDKKEKVEFDSTKTFDTSSTKEATESVLKKIKELIKKDPEKVKGLISQSKIMSQYLKEAKKYKDTTTAKTCAKATNALTTLAAYHDGKEVSDKKLYQAYLDCKYLKKDLKQVQIRIASAKRNTPQAKQIRKFQYSAKYYLKKAARANKQGKKIEAEYYNKCANFKQKAAAVYAKNPKIEATCKAQIKKARIRLNHDLMKEDAVRFRKRAKEYRDDDYEERAVYYEKAAALKEKLAEAYAKNNKSLIKSLKKEYTALQKTKN